MPEIQGKLTILLVHSSWHTPAQFEHVRSVFANAGCSTSCPHLPTARTTTPIHMTEDAQCIRSELIERVEEQQKDVIVVGHSYGGIVSTQATERQFAKEEGKRHGKSGGVLRIVYMCAFLLEDVEILKEVFGGEMPPFIPEDASPYLYHILQFRDSRNDLGKRHDSHARPVTSLLQRPLNGRPNKVGKCISQVPQYRE